MRNLDALNPAMAKPARLTSGGAIIPLVFSVLGLVLASDAAPNIPFTENPICLFSSLILVTACCMLLIPRLFGWGWEAKYFGVPLFYLGSLALMCMVPCLCLVLYSKLQLIVRIGVLLVFVAIHVLWCRRFIVLYTKINDDMDSHRLLYQEDDDAVYYMQRSDKHLIEKRYKFRQVPRDGYFVLFLLLSFSIVPVKGLVSQAVGLPFMCIFFLIGTLPISLMGVGLATRGWLVFYRYPMQIRKSTGKRVYVDMSGTPDFSQQRKRANPV